MILEDRVSVVRGFGPKKVGLLEKMGILTLADALSFYPRDYDDRTRESHIADLRDGDKVTVRAVVGTAPVLRHIRKGMDITKLTVFDGSGTLNLTYFNNKYIAAQLREGEEYLFHGRVQGEERQRTMVSPSCEKCVTGQEKGRIVPVYTLTAGLGQKDMERLTAAALSCPIDLADDPIPSHLRLAYGLPDYRDAVRYIHRPRSLDEVYAARRRMIFEELFLLCCGLQRLKDRRKEESGLLFENTDLQAFWNVLGFAPTGAQRRAVEDCVRDTVSGKPMNRLVQGDVGSGKTVVAAALSVLAAQNGYQAAIMAPTEILASQHYESLSALFAKLGLRAELLTGSMGVKARRETLARIASGEAHVVIGTHALIQKDVEFARLGAVVADEQHRFGVAQRASLRGKGQTPHTLVMSATPIPRTLALILYGDLDVSVIDELPPGRTPVATYAVGERMRKRIYAFMEKQIAAGGQVYVVCPLVEAGEGDVRLKSAEEHAHTLKNELPHRRIGVLHGRMKPAEKDAVMGRFAAGELDVLIATTVIEVGVNVPNANLMVVEDADRFGLSQLHQLRGRVGRGKRESFCVFFGADKGQTARQRLKVLVDTNDGFEIARADLAQRGPGDFFGKRQHGLPGLKMADLASDLQLMQEAREEAESILREDPLLCGYPALRGRVERMFRPDSGEIFN
ncbi:MAG: ATP-dependent DNA helicase RecG [Clostridiaceae bacterium]|nr:ATP-dependent DNA helicase RecG [Clostridiaceae bacterium]